MSQLPDFSGGRFELGFVRRRYTQLDAGVAGAVLAMQALSWRGCRPRGRCTGELGCGNPRVEGRPRGGGGNQPTTETLGEDESSSLGALPN